MKNLKAIALVPVVIAAVLTQAKAEDDALAQLKQKLVAEIDASADASAEVKAFVKQMLLPLCNNPVFVTAVRDQNSRGISLDEIKKTDEAWINAEEELPIHKQVLSNPCADELRQIISVTPAIAEAFVMDNQGANVGQNDLTSDYWQGDEAKWQNSYKEGQGGVDIGKNKLDRSTNRTMQQVSLPICDENGQVVGAVTFGVAVDSI